MEDYMAERNAMPVYGNVAHTTFTYDSVNNVTHFVQAPDITSSVSYTVNGNLQKPSIYRSISADSFSIQYPKNNIEWKSDVPFITNNIYTAVKLVGNKNWVVSHSEAPFVLTQ